MERGDLKPVMAPDGSGLPYELWRGLDVGTLSRLITESISRHGPPALHQLWLRLITSNVTPPRRAASPTSSSSPCAWRSSIARGCCRCRAGAAGGRAGARWDPRHPRRAQRDRPRRAGPRLRDGEAVGSTAALPQPVKPGRGAHLRLLRHSRRGCPPAPGLPPELAREQGL
ncbi:MAG: hypothetical protein WDN31_19920 [Hyphomicrobium sp.]